MHIDYYIDFRKLTRAEEKKKRELIKFFREEFRIWWFHGKIDVFSNYHNVDVINFFKERVTLIENLVELKSLFLTLNSLTNKLNTTTYFYCLLILCKFIDEFELYDNIDSATKDKYDEYILFDNEVMGDLFPNDSLPDIVDLKLKNNSKGSLSRKTLFSWYK